MVLRSEESYLIDFNYTVEKIIGSSTLDYVNEWIVILELYLKSRKKGDESTGVIEKIKIEMSRDDLAQFLK